MPRVLYVLGANTNPGMEKLRSRDSRLGGLGLHIAEYRLLQLRIHLIGDGSDIQQYLVEVQTTQIVLQRLEDTDLEDSRLLYHHSGTVSLPESQVSVLVCGNG